MLVIDAQTAGISGDMMLCSLVDLGADKSRITEGVRGAQDTLGGVEMKKFEFAKTTRHGIAATGLVLDMEEDRDGRPASEIASCIEGACKSMGLAPRASGFAISSIRSLVDAESIIHGEPADSIRLHEAASFDTVVDILGTAIAMEDLGLFGEEIVCTPVAVGGGSITFSHGIVPNPTGAILEILKGSGIAVFGGPAGEELTTPTGACMLRNLAGSCSEFYPMIRVDAVAYGAGTKSFGGFPNVLRLVRGMETGGYTSDSVKVLETTVDDVSGEVLGHMMEKVMAAGARDVTVSPAVAKKGRPAHLITLICDAALAGPMAELLVSETGTLGVRMRTSERLVVPRSSHMIRITINGREFEATYKVNGRTGGFKVESDDIRRISGLTGRPFQEIEEFIRNEIGKEADHG